MAEIKIPFNKPGMTGREQTYMADALQRGHLSGDGYYTKLCNRRLETELGVSKVMLTTSCTHALEMSALLLDIQPGDEVIVPSFTFVSSINAFVLRGAKPIFADIRPDTLNLDENQLESLITEKTRAIVPVHYAGVGCDMDTIGQIAARHNLAVVEDDAQGLFARYKGKPLGSFGQMATVSFHETKNFICGEGGALLINDPAFFERAEIIREKGTNRGRFFRGQVDKYTWVDVGSSYLPAEVLAAFLYAQLEAREEITAKRKRVFEFYQENLAGWAAANGVRLPVVPEDCEQPYHMFYLLFPSLEERQSFIGHMRSKGIQTSFHYLPLHLSDMGRRWGYREGDCPVTEKLSDCLVRLPFFNELTQDQLEEVAETVQAFSVGLAPRV
ncbi:MAG: TDP-4-keto-6-deoxy-D-glucose transaminase [Chloroflexi bacterium]|jgi:dTDP-4-amino-4,6-dideoxygalactose transaminase|nr:TDP-4-keto-6-deoxy-D-glucose transaminase [Chloroflexota bacterium]